MGKKQKKGRKLFRRLLLLGGTGFGIWKWRNAQLETNESRYADLHGLDTDGGGEADLGAGDAASS